MQRSSILISSLIFNLSFSLAATNPADVVAVVGSKQISLKEFNEKYDEMAKNTVNPPGKEIFMEDLVRFEIGVQEANKKGLENDPIVKERFRQELYKGLVEKELGKKVNELTVNENEMKTFYQKNPELRTSHILIEFKMNATPEQKKAAQTRAKEIFDEVKKSKRPFEELANLYSDDSITKKNGGDVGWQSSATLVPQYYQTALKMKVGDVQGIIETQYGYHVIKLTGRHPYDDANKRQIRMLVFDEKRRRVFDEYFEKLKRQYPVKVAKDKLK